MGGWGIALLLFGTFVAVVAAKGTYKYLPPFNSMPNLQQDSATKTTIAQDALATIQAQIAAAYKSSAIVTQ